MLSVATLKAAIPHRYRQAGRRLLLHAASATSAGTKFACPCCGTRLRRFARFHGERDQCPRCGALMRHRALVLLLRDELEIATLDASVLDIGPAESIRRWLDAAPTLRYLASDLTSPLADVLADVTDLPMHDEEFDIVLCIHVLEHVLDDRAGIREIHRVLKPGGLAVFQVPPSDYETTVEDPTLTTPEERERVFGQYDHVRICGADYGQRLRDAGFDVEEIDYVESLSEAERRLYGLRTGEPFFMCRKAGRAG